MHTSGHLQRPNMHATKVNYLFVFMIHTFLLLSYMQEVSKIRKSESHSYIENKICSKVDRAVMHSSLELEVRGSNWTQCC